MLDNSGGFLVLWILEGPLTQVAEYLPFKQRVAGSSPVRPTILNSECACLPVGREFGIRNGCYFGKWSNDFNSAIRIRHSAIKEGPHRLARSRTSAFHVDNRGSNPLGDAKSIASAGCCGFYPRGKTQRGFGEM